MGALLSACTLNVPHLQTAALKDVESKWQLSANSERELAFLLKQEQEQHEQSKLLSASAMDLVQRDKQIEQQEMQKEAQRNRSLLTQELDKAHDRCVPDTCTDLSLTMVSG